MDQPHQRGKMPHLRTAILNHSAWKKQIFHTSVSVPYTLQCRLVSSINLPSICLWKVLQGSNIATLLLINFYADFSHANVKSSRSNSIRSLSTQAPIIISIFSYELITYWRTYFQTVYPWRGQPTPNLYCTINDPQPAQKTLRLRADYVFQYDHRRAQDI